LPRLFLSLCLLFCSTILLLEANLEKKAHLKCSVYAILFFIVVLKIFRYLSLRHDVKVSTSLTTT
jgi:hypothetical protein